MRLDPPRPPEGREGHLDARRAPAARRRCDRAATPRRWPRARSSTDQPVSAAIARSQARRARRGTPAPRRASCAPHPEPLRALAGKHEDHLRRHDRRRVRRLAPLDRRRRPGPRAAPRGSTPRARGGAPCDERVVIRLYARSPEARLRVRRSRARAGGRRRARASRRLRGQHHELRRARRRRRGVGRPPGASSTSDVRVGAAEPEARYARDARRPRRRPRRGARLATASAEPASRIRGLSVRKFRFFGILPWWRASTALIKPAIAGGALEVTDVRLDRAEDAPRAVGARRAEHVAERLELDRVAQRRPRPVRLDVAHGSPARPAPRASASRSSASCAQAVRRRQPVAAAVLVRPRSRGSWPRSGRRRAARPTGASGPPARSLRSARSRSRRRVERAAAALRRERLEARHRSSSSRATGAGSRRPPAPRRTRPGAGGWQARCTATSDDEQAVSTVTHGPVEARTCTRRGRPRRSACCRCRRRRPSPRRAGAAPSAGSRSTTGSDEDAGAGSPRARRGRIPASSSASHVTSSSRRCCGSRRDRLARCDPEEGRVEAIDLVHQAGPPGRVAAGRAPTSCQRSSSARMASRPSSSRRQYVGRDCPPRRGTGSPCPRSRSARSTRRRSSSRSPVVRCERYGRVAQPLEQLVFATCRQTKPGSACFIPLDPRRRTRLARRRGMHLTTNGE